MAFKNDRVRHLAGMVFGWAILSCGSGELTSPPLPPGHPNEPPGFTSFYENAYTALPPASGTGWSTVGPSKGCWSTEFGLVPVIRTDPTAPSGQGVVYGLKFHAGILTGQGPGLTAEWETCAASNTVEYRKLYTDMWIKLAGGPNGDLSDWEFNAGVTKVLGFWGVGRNFTGGNGGDMIGRVWGGPGQFESSREISWVNEATNLRAFAPNAGSQNLVVGQWHRVEILMELGSSPGATDGVLRIWVDGTMVHDWTDVAYNSPSNPSGFYQKHNSPTWGGGSSPIKTRDDWIYYDHMYMSGVP